MKIRMRSRVQKWGNSLAVRIPKPFAAEAGLAQDASVEVSVRGGELVIARSPAPEYSLAELLEKVTSRNIHREIPTGRPVGREVW